MSEVFGAFECDGQVSIYQYTGTKEKVVIPDFFEGLPVKKILAEAFKGKKNLKEIALPSQLDEIFISAFEDCENLEKIHIPDTVLEIGSGAFRNCISLKDVKLPSNLEQISIGVFEGCEQLKEINLPENIKSIGMKAFSGCYKLENVELSENLNYIGYSAFSHCYALKEVVFPENLVRVSGYSFCNCKNLNKAIQLSECTEIDNDVFFGCENIQEFNLPILKSLMLKLQCKLLNEIFLTNELSKEEMKKIITYIKRKKTLKKSFFTSDNVGGITFLLNGYIKIPLDELDLYIKENINNNNTGVIAILLDYKEKNFSNEELSAYKEQIELVEIGLEYPTLKQLKEKWRCSKVEGGLRISSYKGNETIETIPSQTADGIKIVELTYINGNKNKFEPIETLTIEAQITAIGDKTFRGCKTLKRVNLPDTLTKIGNQSFLGCRKLEHIELLEGIEEIDLGAFSSCENLTKIDIPVTTRNINSHAFSNCINLKNVTLPKSANINKMAFEDSPLVNLIKY